jgi:hypothetical protein
MKRGLAFPVLVSALAFACNDGSPTGPERGVMSVADAQLAQAPADGNGNKDVIVVSITNPVTCPNGETLIRTVGGWIQVRSFDRATGKVALEVYHQTFTFTRSDGTSYVWHDVGPNRYWMEDGFLMVAIVGRSGGHIGTLTVNLDTGEVVFSAGRDIALPRVLACAALT